ALMLKTVIHDWYDEEAAAILANCRKALGPGGVVLLVERIAPELAGEDPDDLEVIRTDMLMLTAAGGQERTRRWVETLFSKAGMKLQSVTMTASAFAVLEAVSV